MKKIIALVTSTFAVTVFAAEPAKKPETKPAAKPAATKAAPAAPAPTAPVKK